MVNLCLSTAIATSISIWSALHVADGNRPYENFARVALRYTFALSISLEVDDDVNACLKLKSYLDHGHL